MFERRGRCTSSSAKFPAEMYARVTKLVLILAFVLHCALSFDSRNVVFTIISQTEPYHASVAKRLKQSIESQVLELENRHPKVHLTHEDFPAPGAWTIIPLLGPLTAKYGTSGVRWVLFVETHTAVRCGKLLEALAAADRQNDTMWVGYPLTDEEPTIIHHFSIYEDLEEEGGFVYPNFASGFAMRMELIQKLLNQIESGERKLEADFSIDPAYELAQLVYGSSADPGPLLTPDLSFCIVSGDNCATYPLQFDTCGSPVPEQSIFFAVKTWRGYHNTRAKVVKKTWGRHVTNLLFFSDKDDPSLPAVDVGIPNTKTGHCAKTMAILRQAVERARRMPHIKWIFLADDDTILGQTVRMRRTYLATFCFAECIATLQPPSSVPTYSYELVRYRRDERFDDMRSPSEGAVQRLCEVLSCYRGGDDVTILGERYGYGYGKRETAAKGYDYITGGGGVALSVAASARAGACACARDAPDDMALGACATHRLHVSLTHLPLFHQARPQDYPREVLSRDRPVSFHRHSSPDPLKVYATWFQRDDLAIRRRRDEL